MSGRRILTLMAATAILAPVLASAQETNSRVRRFTEAKIPDTARLSEAEKAQRTMDAYGDCVLDHSAKRAAQYIVTVPGDASDKLAHGLAINECMYLGRLVFSDSVLRGALYRALYRRNFEKAPVALKAEPIDYMADFQGQPDRSQYVALRQFSECVVRANPAASRELTLALAGTQRAKTAFAMLMPAFGPCVPQGNNVSFSKSMIAGLIGESLYRLSSSPVPVKKEAVE